MLCVHLTFEAERASHWRSEGDVGGTGLHLGENDIGSGERERSLRSFPSQRSPGAEKIGARRRGEARQGKAGSPSFPAQRVHFPSEKPCSFAVLI